MKFYFAPMEGIAGYIYRKAHYDNFSGIDKYFSPFVVPQQKGKLKNKEYKDVLPENNKGLDLIPQIMTNQAKDFIHTSKIFKELGYEEVNLNLGCPSSTVVSKFRGSGFLKKPEELNHFLSDIFEASITKISIKTRIGFYEPEEFYQLLEIYNQYPLAELIVHPRTREDYYKNQPNLTLFSEAVRLSKHPICYNGDIRSIGEMQALSAEFPNLEAVMIGRGLLANPGLVEEIKERQRVDTNRIKAFHQRLYLDYKNVLSGEHNVLFKMKELWLFLLPTLTENEKYLKKMKKVDRLADYDILVEKIFQEIES